MKNLRASDIHLKKRDSGSHKGDNGRVLIVGGSPAYVGAVALAGLAALRSGTDWVTVASPEKVAWAINCLTPDLITAKMRGHLLLPRHERLILELASHHDSVVLGNGMGLAPGTRRLCAMLARKIEKPIVIDADAIKAIKLEDAHGAIITPHFGELSMLLKNSGITTMPKRESDWKPIQKRLTDNVLLVKGPTDYVVSSERIITNTMHDPSMTVAGTGDVLAGLCAGFLAQGYPLFESACYGAYFNGLTGTLLAARKKYPSLIASDLVNDITSVMASFKKKRRML